jgi:hypothetical protein
MSYSALYGRHTFFAECSPQQGGERMSSGVCVTCTNQRAYAQFKLKWCSPQSVASCLRSGGASAWPGQASCRRVQEHVYTGLRVVARGRIPVRTRRCFAMSSTLSDSSHSIDHWDSPVLFCDCAFCFEKLYLLFCGSRGSHGHRWAGAIRNVCFFGVFGCIFCI